MFFDERNIGGLSWISRSREITFGIKDEICEEMLPNIEIKAENKVGFKILSVKQKETSLSKRAALIVSDSEVKIVISANLNRFKKYVDSTKLRSWGGIKLENIAVLRLSTLSKRWRYLGSFLLIHKL